MIRMHITPNIGGQRLDKLQPERLEQLDEPNETKAETKPDVEDPGSEAAVDRDPGFAGGGGGVWRWRWRWDLNPRRLSPHTLSRRAP
jgi:hypothetical protein